MKKQDTTEWLEITKIGRIDYHERQFKTPYRSTVKFCEFLDKLGILKNSKEIIDIGCGGGANIFCMAKKYREINFTGLDINMDLVRWGNGKLSNIRNAKLIQGDLYNVERNSIGRFDGVISFQTLSWLPEYKDPLMAMVSLDPKWIAITSLFYDGPVNLTIKVQDYSEPLLSKPYTESYYNIYSLDLIKEFLKNNRFEKCVFEPFEIDIDMPRPKTKGMKTYTERLANGRRIQISGPLLMPWYFIYASK